MPTVIPTADDAGNQAIDRPLLFDPRQYPNPDQRDVSAEWIGRILFGELIRIAEIDSYTRRVRAKNTTGSDQVAGMLWNFGTVNLTSRPSQVSTTSPSQGINVVLELPSVTGYEVGQYVTITDSGYTETAIVTAVGATNITVNRILESHTLPTVTALAAIKGQLGTCNGTGIAEWVNKDS